MTVTFQTNRRFRPVAALNAAFLCVSVACILPASAAYTEAEVNEMIRYADGLTRWGMPDYSAKVLRKLGNNPLVYAARIRVLGQTAQWDEIDAIINAQPDPDSQNTWVMKLSKADALYAHGKYDDAKTVYTAFFSRYSTTIPESIKSFYLESAYKYAQMVLLLGDLEAAVQAYESVLRTKPEKDVARQMTSDLAEVLLRLAEETKGSDSKEYIAKADTLAEELLWVQDIWFGKAIVYKAHGMILNGDVEGAFKIFEDYKSTLIEIDKHLQAAGKAEGVDFDRYSPVAQCRFLLGKVLHEEAKKQIAAGATDRAATMLLGGKGSGGGKVLGAMQHLVNVFIRYPKTSWAAEAGVRVEEIRILVEEELGRELSFRVTPDQWKKVQQAQLGNARMLVNKQQYEDAADVYINILTLFPEDENTPTALSGLAECYMESDNDLYARMTLGHLASRYGRNRGLSDAVGNAILRMATLYGERKKPEVRNDLYDRFFDNFPEHPRTSLLLTTFGDERAAEERYDAALDYYERAVAIQKGSPLYYNALLKQASCYAKLDRRADQIKTLTRFNKEVAEEDRPGHRLIKGLYRMASAYRSLGPRHYGASINRYKDIEKRLSGKDASQYALNEDEKKANASILEGSQFYKSYCYSKFVPKDPASASKYKAAALKGYLALAKDHPESNFAPAALLQAGTLWTVFGKAESAQKVFADLKRNYPETDEAKNVDFRLAMSLLEIGMRKRANLVFKQMFSGDGSYRPSEILRAANELVKAEEYEIALEGFERVLEKVTPEERALMEPVLIGQGRCLMELERLDESLLTLEKVFELYPKTGRTVDIAMLLSRGYAEQALNEPDNQKRFAVFNKSVDSMNRVRKYLKTGEGRAMSDVGIGKIYELKSAAAEKYGPPEDVEPYTGEAIGVYMLMVETADHEDPKVRPHLEDAYARCIDLLIQGEHWADAKENAERYLEAFKSGTHKINVRKWYSIAKSKDVSRVAPPDATTTNSNADASGDTAAPSKDAGANDPAGAGGEG